WLGAVVEPLGAQDEREAVERPDELHVAGAAEALDERDRAREQRLGIGKARLCAVQVAEIDERLGLGGRAGARALGFAQRLDEQLLRLAVAAFEQRRERRVARRPR